MLKKTATTIIISILLSLFFYSSTVSSANKALRFQMPGTEGTVDLANFHGKVVYLDFWASWCIPCRKSFPWMSTLQARYKDKGFEVIAIALDESPSDATAFLRKYPAAFTIGFDREGKSAEAYGVKVMPTSYLIDKKGFIVKTYQGSPKNYQREIEATIEKLVAE